MKVFIDTSALIALNDKMDQYHEVAREFVSGLSVTDELITSNYIIDETITHLRHSIGIKATMKFAETIFSQKICQIIYVDREIEKDSYAIFCKYSDKYLSFTDCTSFALMKRMGISKAFAFDEDFLAVGLEVVPLKY